MISGVGLGGEEHRVAGGETIICPAPNDLPSISTWPLAMKAAARNTRPAAGRGSAFSRQWT